MCKHKPINKRPTIFIDENVLLKLINECIKASNNIDELIELYGERVKIGELLGHINTIRFNLHDLKVKLQK